MMVIMTVTYDRSFLFQRYCDDGVDSEWGQDFRPKLQSRLQRFQSQGLTRFSLQDWNPNQAGCLAKLNLSPGKTEKGSTLNFYRFLQRTVVGAARVGRAQRVEVREGRARKPGPSGDLMWTGCSQVGSNTRIDLRWNCSSLMKMLNFCCCCNYWSSYSHLVAWCDFWN